MFSGVTTSGPVTAPGASKDCFLTACLVHSSPEQETGIHSTCAQYSFDGHVPAPCYLVGSSHFCSLELRPSTHCIPEHLNASYQVVRVAKRRIKRKLTLSQDKFLLNIPGKNPNILYRENSIKSMEHASQNVFSNCHILYEKIPGVMPTG